MKKIIFIALFTYVLPFLALAAPVPQNLSTAFGDSGPLKGSDGVADAAGYDLEGDSMDSMIGNIIKIVLSFLGIIFLVLIIQAGYLWMTAQGDQAKVQKAKDIMERAVIGLIIVVGAYAISEYVILSVGRGQLNNLESAQ